MPTFWQTFWSNYGPEKAITEDDLFLQVAQTWKKKPISRELFKRTLNYIEKRLDLSSRDHLLDLCCGNGLISYELATQVDFVTGIDFVPRNIHAANEWKLAKNIIYILGDVTEPMPKLIGETIFPNKYLMNGSLAYFEPVGLNVILKNIMDHMGGRPFRILFTSIPCFELKWNFYNTVERVSSHLKNEKKLKNINDGVGRWWHPDEIKNICSQNGLQVEVTEQPLDLSNYRMDALVTSP